MTRVVFLGTPEFAVPTLQALADAPDFEVVGVVTQPDRPAGRGKELRAPAIKSRALALGLPVIQPEKLKEPGAVEQLQAWAPDLIVVAAFGQILRKTVLDLPAHGCINVHASLLPRWRGAAPIQYAVLHGDRESGVTIMQMDPGLDTGPMLASRAIPLAPDETGASLHDKLSALGAQLLLPTLRDFLSGSISPQPQPEAGVTLAPSIEKEAGRIDWSKSAIEIDRQIRAFDPWPGSYTLFSGEICKVLRGRPLPEAPSLEAPGTLIEREGRLLVAAGQGVYEISELQPANKKRMSAAAFLAGRRDLIGRSFES